MWIDVTKLKEARARGVEELVQANAIPSIIPINLLTIP
jgi:hypothetical protein